MPMEIKLSTLLKKKLSLGLESDAEALEKLWRALGGDEAKLTFGKDWTKMKQWEGVDLTKDKEKRVRSVKWGKCGLN